MTGKLGRHKFNESFTPGSLKPGYHSEFKINSMIDISGGFAIDLYQFLKKAAGTLV